jgi:hypothetical protein
MVPMLVRDFWLSDFNWDHITDAATLPCMAKVYNMTTKGLPESVRDFLAMLAPVLTIAIGIGSVCYCYCLD